MVRLSVGVTRLTFLIWKKNTIYHWKMKGEKNAMLTQHLFKVRLYFVYEPKA